MCIYDHSSTANDISIRGLVNEILALRLLAMLIDDVPILSLRHLLPETSVYIFVSPFKRIIMDHRCALSLYPLGCFSSLIFYRFLSSTTNLN